MNHDIFRSMREQMNPSEGAQAALREKLAAPSPAKRPAPWKKYAAVAACACTSPVRITGAESAEKSYPAFFRDFESLRQGG